MSNTINPDQIPVATIEDITLPGVHRLSKANGRRLHKRWLGNMYGAFLTLLDEEGRILFFAAGALRRRVSKTADQVVSLGLADLLRGMTGDGAASAFQPDYKVQTLEGPDRRPDYPLEFKEIPFLTTYLGRQLEEANSWGILRVGPAPDKVFDGFRPNGTNAELFLDPRTWKESAVAGSVPGSGSNDLTARLAPRALEIAENYPSAWTLAITSAYLFGGMTTVPTATPIKASSVVNALIDHETDTRRRKKEAMEVARASRMAAARAGHEVGDHMNVLRDAIDPERLAAIEAKIQGE